MKIRVLYEEGIQKGYKHYTTIEIPDGDYSLMLDADYEMRLAEAKPEKKAEVKRCETVEEMFDLMNKTEYNNWHQFDRHRGMPKTPFRKDNESEDETDAMDTFADWSDTHNRNHQDDFDDLCQKIRKELKSEYAEMIIAIHLDGLEVQEYAALIGDKPNNVSHRLQRAEKKLKSIFSKTSFLTSSQGYEVEGNTSNKTLGGNSK